jgi:site-specific recombinase XerD
MRERTNAHRRAGEAIKVSPHVLRHTFLLHALAYNLAIYS